MRYKGETKYLRAMGNLGVDQILEEKNGLFCYVS